jgi:chaperonin GroEL (HSP60 family)
MSLIKEYYDKMQDGEISPLEAYAMAKQVDAEHQQYLEEMQAQAIEESKKWQEKSFAFKGFQFEKRQGSRRFDFKNISEWKVAKENIAAVEDKYKIAWEASNKANMHSVTEDGEVLELPQVTYSKDVIIVKTLKK